MGKIKIGADELILWLRKNEKAANLPNDEIHGLGAEIRRTIEKLGGHLTIKNQACFWANEDGDKNIGKFNLPKTAAQYEIEVDKLPQLFETIMKW